MTRGRYCAKCDVHSSHEHVDMHHKSRIEGNAEYQAQIEKDRAAGMVEAKDEREKLK